MLIKRSYSLAKARRDIIGLNGKVPLISGKKTRYINLDNAASTPCLGKVFQKVSRFLHWYSSVHRGTGYKSMLSTEIYEKAHTTAAEFVNADPELHTVVFVKNTTEAINKLSYRLDFSNRNTVISTCMEHHSNDLPWRDKARVLYVKVDDEGVLDLNHLELLLKKHGRKTRLVTVTGASNVTGHINDIHTIAQLAHKAGAQIMVDAAQLAPHRHINMAGKSEGSHIDYLAFSAHKMYAPFGIGVLIGPKTTFLQGSPDYSGGGTVAAVSKDFVAWGDLPDKEEAGSPNVVGAVAAAEAVNALSQIGMDSISKHEENITKYALKQLQKFEDVRLYGCLDLTKQQRVGVITFNIKGVNHALTASVLSHEFGIAVRNGCFCAHPYVHNLLKLTPSQVSRLQKRIISQKKYNLPGMVRISFGLYNTKKDVDCFLKALKNIIELKNNNLLDEKYQIDTRTGAYTPIKKMPYTKPFQF